MKEITLNPDGTLNIIDPRKIYCLIINWDQVPEETWMRGIKYYLPKELSLGLWRYERQNGGTYGYFGEYNEKHLQYVVEGCLKKCKRPRFINASQLLEFNDQEEYNQWRDTL